MIWESDWYLKYPIAHRGLHMGRGIPENSMASFKACIEKRFPIELDVHLMTDGTALVFHDDSFERMTGHEREVELSNYDYVKNLVLYETDERIPTLEDVLTLVNGQVPLVVELKCHKHDGRLEHKVYNILKEYSGPYCIQSFNPLTLLWFKRYAPEVIRGMLGGSLNNTTVSFWKKLVVRSLAFVFFVRPHYIAFEWNKFWYPSLWLLRVFSKIPIIAWCISNKDQHDFIRPKSANIIFENFDPTGSF